MDLDYPRAVLALLGVAVVVALLVVAGTSGSAFGAYNPTWDGVADLRTVADRAGADVEIARETGVYASVDPNGTIAVVLSPDEPYATRATARVEEFVRSGGTLLVAEDFGPHANALLSGIGARARFDGRILRDERYHHRAPALPIARNVTEHSLTAGVESLTLNYGTPIRPGGASIVVGTSAFAYVDANRNGKLDASESMRSYPVVTVEEVGEGRVIAVGDPSAFINAMLDRPGNRAFVENLLNRERVVLDHSHLRGVPPLAVAILTLRSEPLFGWLFGILGIVAIALGVRGPPSWPGGRSGEDGLDGRLDESELRAYVERRHPDWEDERVERVIRGVLVRRDEGGDDD